MKKLIVIPLLLVAATSFSQVLIRACVGVKVDSLAAVKWEVWKDVKYSPYWWDKDYHDRMTEEEIQASIDKHSAQASQYDGEWVLEFMVDEGYENWGFYHIRLVHAQTGELLGSTVAQIEDWSMNLGGGLRLPNPINNAPVVGVRVSDTDPIFFCVNHGCRTPPAGWVK